MKVEEETKLTITLTEEEEKILTKAEDILNELYNNLDNHYSKCSNTPVIVGLQSLRMRLMGISDIIEGLDDFL